MIVYLLYVLVCMGLIVLQTTLLSTFPISDNFYDLLIPFVLYLGLFRPFAEGLSLVLIFGYVMDAFSGGPFGLYMITYFWLFMGMRGMIQFLQSRSLFLRVFVVGAGVLAENVIILGTLTVLWKDWSMSASDLRTAILQVMWALCTGYFFLMFIEYCHTTVDAWIEQWYLNRREYKA